MSDWTTEFFTTHALDAWQRAQSAETTEQEVAFLRGALQLDDAAKRVLDVPCGDGRHAVALAALGHKVTGVDIAPDNQQRATQRAEAAGVSFEYVLGDMRGLRQGQRFDAAYCMGNSFGYFPRHESLGFIAALGALLPVGGRFVLDTATAAESILVELSRQSFVRVDDELLLLLECEYDAVDSRLETTYTTIRDDRVVDTRTSYHYVFTSGEIIAMLADAGLEAMAALGDLEGSPFELGAERLLIVAEKR